MEKLEDIRNTFVQDFEDISDFIIPGVDRPLIEYVYRKKLYSPPKRSKYSEFLFWYKVKFDDNIRKQLKEEYRSVQGMNIMPYRITQEDVMTANQKKRKYSKEEIKLELEHFVDYDRYSANYHKKPDGRYQVVLYQHNYSGKTKKPDGPGWKEDGKSGKLDGVKDTWYFPDMKKTETEQVNMVEGTSYLRYLIKDVFDTIFR